MKSVYPYRRLDDAPGLFVDGITLDAEDLDLAALDHAGNEIDLRGSDSAPWKRASLKFRLGTTPVLLDGAWDDLRPVLVLECGRSNTRVALAMTPAARAEDGWTCEVEIVRSDWYGTVQVIAVITANLDGVVGRDIGRTATWLLRIDDLPSNQSIPVTWSDFGNDTDRQFLKPHEKEPYFLSLSSGPHLYLNKGFPGLFGLLDDRPRRPAAERALHDIARAEIAAQVWAGMFAVSLAEAALLNQGAAAVPGDEEDLGPAEWPAEGWQRDVLKVLLGQIYPGFEGSDGMDKALRDALSCDGASLQERLFPALLRVALVPKLMGKAIDSVTEAAS